MSRNHGLLAALLLVVGVHVVDVGAAYALVDNFAGSSWLDGFDFFNGADPTHGFVKYLNRADAISSGLVSVSGSQFYMGVNSNDKAPSGRASVRLHSKKLYNKGLFILDLVHMPSSTCGSWPSWWSWGAEKTWPANGEIDIIEGVHTNTRNAMSLHTADGCSIDGLNSLGHVDTKNCFIQAPGQTSNAGCGIQSSSSSSFGTPFNANGGGVFATEWTSSGIKMWFFPRNAIPNGVNGTSPDPASWGTPDASFQGNCDFNKHVINQQFVLDTTFCGDWAGAVWAANPTCTALSASCNDYVANNPAAFKESYWRINYFKVFQDRREVLEAWDTEYEDGELFQ